MDQNNILYGLINNLKTTLPTKIVMSLLSFLENLLQDNQISLKKNVGNFEIAHKTCSTLIWGAFTVW